MPRSACAGAPHLRPNAFQRTHHRGTPSYYDVVVRSLRLDPELEARLERAAAVEGASVSEFIRRAAAARADEVLTADNSELFADVLGVIAGGGGRARRSGAAFAEGLAKDRADQ